MARGPSKRATATIATADERIDASFAPTLPISLLLRGKVAVGLGPGMPVSLPVTRNTPILSCRDVAAESPIALRLQSRFESTAPRAEAQITRWDRRGTSLGRTCRRRRESRPALP